MEINRNQYFLAGLVILLLGTQLRLTDSLILTPRMTRMLAEHSGHPAVAAADTATALTGVEINLPPKRVVPPDWFGWFLISVGSVLLLHSLAMKRPE